jgi:hypothetical protein
MRERLTSLADTMAGSDPVKAKAAMLQMTQDVHGAAAPGQSKALRAELLKELMAIVASKRPRAARAHATRLIGYIGSKGEDKALARLATDPELRADIQMARERLRRGG